MTKSQARQLIQQMIDDREAVRWPTVILDLLIESGLDDLYSEVLETFPYAVSALEEPSALVSPGIIYWRYGTGTAELANRPFAIQSLTRDGQEYGLLDPGEVVLEDGAVVEAEDYGYVFFGDELHVFPYDTTANIELRYSYRPPRFSQMTESTSIQWPDGHQMVFLAYIAGLASNKGSQEDPSNWFRIYGASLSRMLSAIKRRSPGPAKIRTMDTSVGWGSIT